MNFAYMVNQSSAATEGSKSCGCKKDEQTESFEQALAEMMNSGDAQISVKQVQVTGVTSGQNFDQMTDQESLKNMFERIDYMLDMLFTRNGIPKDPPVEIEYSYTRTEVTITGDREDIEEIKNMINDDEDIKELISSALGLAGKVVNMAESLAFQREYSTSDDAADVVDRYSHLFDENRNTHIPSLRYGDDLSLLSDGKTYQL